MGDRELRCRLLMLANILLLPLLGCLYFLGKLRLRVKARKAESSEATSPSLQQPHPSPSSPLQHLGKLRPREGDEESCCRPGGPGERCGGRGPSLPRHPLSSRVQRAPHAPAVGPPGAHRAPAPAANPPHPAPGVGGTARAPCTPPCAHRLGLFICGPHPLHPRGPSCPPPAPRGAPGRR